MKPMCNQSQWNSTMEGISPKFLAPDSLKTLRLALKIWVNILNVLARFKHSICQGHMAHVFGGEVQI